MSRLRKTHDDLDDLNNKAASNATSNKQPDQADGATMTLWEHLEELRKRLQRAVGAFVVGTVAAWFAREQLLTLLVYPFQDAWNRRQVNGPPLLHFAAPGDAFIAYIKQSMIAGLLFASPFIFWQAWAFVAPGLYAKEKKSALLFVTFSTLLFVTGAVFSWSVAMPAAFGYLLGLSGTVQSSGIAITPTVMMTDYLDFAGRLLVAFGVIFEIPIVSLFLAIGGLIDYRRMWKFGRWFVLIAFCVGAILTPPDVPSQLIMAIPMCLLYLVSIGLVYIAGKRRERLRP